MFVKLSSNSRTTDSRGAANSAELVLYLMPRSAACALIAVLFLGAALFAAPAGQATASKKATAKTATTAKATATEKSSSKLIDINTASADELDALPGIGKAYSKKIIDNRPYQSKNQLVSKHVLPESVYNGVKDRIVARQKK